MFVLTCEIKIGSYKIQSATDVKIKKSIHSYVDTATITLPLSSRLSQGAKSDYVQKSAPEATEFKVGQPVEIRLGYDGKLNLEFTGFVKKVNVSMPCEIECEGYSWKLKQKNVLWTTGKEKKKLKELLGPVVEGTGVKLSNAIPDIDVQQAYQGNMSALEVLDWIKKNLYLTAYFTGNELYVGLAYTEMKVRDNITYQLGWNTVKEDQLKFRGAEDVKIQVKAVSFTNRNKAIVGKSPDNGGAIRTIYVQNIGTEAELNKLAESEAKKLVYDGYEGKIIGFLEPFALPNYSVSVVDLNYPDRAGTYLIESTEVKFGLDGGRRTCEVGIKISD